VETSQYGSQDLDHLGIVAGMCYRVGLINRIDERVKDTGREVSVGQAVQAMVLNGLGFVGRPLYLTPEFYRTKAGITEVFAYVAGHALREMGIETDYVHLDSTSFGLHGDYETETDEPAVIEVTYGYSRDHRPDLKQVVLSLICAHEGAIPIWLEALSGNSADSSSFKQTVRTYLDHLKTEQHTPYIVADTALYNAETLSDLGETVKWVTRVPASIGLAKELYQGIELKDMAVMDDNYRVFRLGSVYVDVRQRWLLLYSESLYHQQAKTFNKQLVKQRREAEKQLRRLSRREYVSPEAAQAAVEALADDWAYHAAVVEVEAIPHFEQRGRPAQGQPPDYYTWKLTGQVVDDQAAIDTALARKGRFILATNELDEARLSDQQIITVYKGQNTSVERGFRFLKDPLMFAESFYLKKPSRIMALLMVMGLCLLIYALAEHRLRSQLVAQNETIPDQKGRPTQRITMRRVFQMFEGIHILTIRLPHDLRRVVTNLSDVHLQILRLLGPPFEKCYLLVS
jgi:transposase